MEWFTKDRTIGLYGSTHLLAEVSEVERFLAALDPMMVAVEVHETETPNPDMQVAIDFANARKRQVAYIGYSTIELVLDLGRKHPLHTAYWFGITTCNQGLETAASKEALGQTAHTVLYNVVETINPPEKSDVLKEAIAHVDIYIEQLWPERERAVTELVSKVKARIEQREAEEPIDGFGRYMEIFQHYTDGKIWNNTERAIEYARAARLIPAGVVAGQWHFPCMKERLEAFTRR